MDRRGRDVERLGLAEELELVVRSRTERVESNASWSGSIVGSRSPASWALRTSRARNAWKSRTPSTTTLRTGESGSESYSGTTALKKQPPRNTSARK